jgi:pimeloyl-ACP methyl ester carboxylesterase
MPLIIFSHANSFPASTYRVMFKSLRARGFTVKAIDKLGHDPAYPVTNNWPHLAKQVADFAAAEIQKAGEPAFLVGHSLGGFLSVMVAARHPELGGHGIKGVLLLDSPLVGGWKAAAVSVAKRTPLFESMSPASVSKTRRNSWPSREVALAMFQAKKAFARWEPQVLKDYIDHGMVMDSAKDLGKSQGNETGKLVLGFNREIETAIYNTLPHNLERLVKRHPLQCPVAFIGGTRSREMKQVGMALTEKLAKGRITMVEGSHLFPMEKPLETAAAIQQAILAMAE